MKNIKLIACAALIAATSATGASFAHERVQYKSKYGNSNFGRAAVLRINHNGFQKCRSLGDSGYTAVARGLLDDGGGIRTGSDRPFQVRTCFETAKACNHFIKRIRNRIGGIQKIRYIACSPRG